jgi:UDP-N-acetylmuramyl tripeptide synthase
LWFGLDDTRVAEHELPHAADARTCPRCGASLIFDAVYVGHDGVYRCPNDDFKRPTPEITAGDIELDGFENIAMTIRGTASSYSSESDRTTHPVKQVNQGPHDQRIKLPLGGLYNVYNVLAAYTAGVTMGHDPAYIAEKLQDFRAAFGRQERMEFRGRHLNLVLSKNPAGFNETLRTAVDLAKGHNFLIALNDRKADGTDVSWIWDVDFERLEGSAHALVPAGNRAHDLAVRFKYAGVDATPPQTDPGKALDALVKATPEGETAHLLCTYTAMLDLRAELVRRGWAKPYWET